MKLTLYRVMPFAAMAMDLWMLWANASGIELFTLDHLRTQLMHLTGHLLDVRCYDWIFDCLQSLPDNYSDFNSEELMHQLTAKLDALYWMIATYFLTIAAQLFLNVWRCPGTARFKNVITSQHVSFQIKNLNEIVIKTKWSMEV